MPKKITVALISIFDEFAEGNRCLAAFVEKHGYHTCLYFLGRYTGLAQGAETKDINCLVNTLVNKSPNVIGLSVCSFYHETAQIVTERLRELLPNSLIIWGGAHPTILPDECIKLADVVCLSEGEGPLLDLLEAKDKGVWPRAIEGMWVRNSSGIIKGGFRPPIQDLDSIPSFSPGGRNKFLIEEGRSRLYDSIPLGTMTRYGIRQYNMITSRGCNLSCTYCINSFLHKHHRRLAHVRRRSIGHVIAELNLVKKDVDMINFQDDDFLADRKWIQDFLPRYKAEITLPFLCLATPIHVCDEEYLRELRKAGLISINVGIQSGSERTQRTFRRPFKREHIIQISRICRRLGLLPQFDVILNNPLESESDISETLNLLLDLRRPFRLNLFSLTFFPNYEITKFAVEQGVIARPEAGYTKFENESGDYASKLPMNNFIYLTQVNLFPKFLIRWMSRSRWIAAHPKLAEVLVKGMQCTLGGRILYLILLVLLNFRMAFQAALRRLIVNPKKSS